MALASRLLKTIHGIQRASVLNIVPVRLSHEISIQDWEKSIIGNREIVGPGINNQANYFDRPDFPCPAIRFKTDEGAGIVALREKEKGDWHKLSLEEKKTLYRASFCQTLTEATASTTEWKSIVGMVFFFWGVSLWVFMAIKKYVCDPLPESMTLENRQAQLMRILDLELEDIEGISSRYDYEKGDWKK